MTRLCLILLWLYDRWTRLLRRLGLLLLCRECSGQGRIYRPAGGPETGDLYQEPEDCDRCDGTGLRWRWEGR